MKKGTNILTWLTIAHRVDNTIHEGNRDVCRSEQNQSHTYEWIVPSMWISQQCIIFPIINEYLQYLHSMIPCIRYSDVIQIVWSDAPRVIEKTYWSASLSEFENECSILVEYLQFTYSFHLSFLILTWILWLSLSATIIWLRVFVVIPAGRSNWPALVPALPNLDRKLPSLSNI